VFFVFCVLFHGSFVVQYNYIGTAYGGSGAYDFSETDSRPNVLHEDVLMKKKT